MQPSDHVLIHAGASGVGTAASQLCRAQSAARSVIVTAGSAQKLARCRDLGATHTCNYKTERFEQTVSHATGGHGADVILDFIGGPYLVRNMASAALDGRIVQLGLMGGGAVPEAFDVSVVLQKRLTLVGSSLRNRPLEYKERLTREFVQRQLPLLASGELQPIIDSVYPLERVDEAHQHVAANANVGKVILSLQ